MSEETQQAIAEMRKATRCLFIEVPESIATDVQSRSERVIALVEQAQRERERDELANKLKDAQLPTVGHVQDIYALTKVTAERDEALAACAAMQESLEKVLEVAEFIDDETGHQSAHIKAALSSECGKDFLEELRRLRSALKAIKLHCLTTRQGIPEALATIVRLCIDAGIEEHYEELERQIRSDTQHINNHRDKLMRLRTRCDEALWLLTHIGGYERRTDNAEWWERREKFIKEAQ